MSDVFVVVPSDDRAELREVFRRAGMEMPGGIPADCVIDRIEIDPAAGEWVVYLAGPAALGTECESAIAGAFREFTCATGHEVVVRVELCTEAECVSLARLDPAVAESSWEAVVSKMTAESPAIGVWLGQSRCTTGPSGVVVEVPGEVLRDKLIERGCQQLVAEAFACTCACAPPEVVIEVGDFEEPEEPEPEPSPASAATGQRPRPDQRLQPQPPTRAGAAQGWRQQPDDGSAAKRPRRKGRQPDPGAIRGRLFTDVPIAIASIGESDRRVVCAGEVFGKETRSTRSGSTILTFSLTDRTDSISCKCFCDPGDAALNLEEDSWVAVRGDMQYDQYARESILAVADIIPYTPPERRDDAAEKRVELHLHTKMSAMDSVCDVGRAIQRAASWGHAAVAITDHGVVQSFPEAFAAGKKHGIKILYGMEGYLTDSDSDVDGETYHVTLLARNAEGLRQLYSIVSDSHLSHFHRHPRILRSTLQACREHLLVGSACAAGELLAAAVRGAGDEELRRLAGFYDYLEIMPPRNDEFLVRSGKLDSMARLEEIIERIYRIGTELGRPVVATGDVHFLDPADEVYRRVLMAGQGYTDADHQAPLYLHTTDEMVREFAFLAPEARRAAVIENPVRIAEMIESVCPVPQELAIPEIDGAEDEIKGWTATKAREIYGDELPDVVRSRLNRELEAIIGHGYAVTYDIAAKLVKKSVSDGYPVGSRGSVGSSLVATMCGITEVNPLPPHYRCTECKASVFDHGHMVESGYDLPDMACPNCGAPMTKDGQSIPFETFMGFEGDKVPDIDLNFSGEHQWAIHKYAEELFGADHVFRAGTIATVAEKTAFGFVKSYAQARGLTLRHAELARLARGCSGVKRTTGQHPGGLMIVPRGRNVHEFTPVQRPANDKSSTVVTTHFEYRTIHDCLLKLDLLGHDDPTAIKMLQDLTGIEPASIPMDDEATMSIFSSPEALGLTPSMGWSVGTVAIPEFGTKFVRGMLEETRPKTFGELVRISGLSHGTDVWLNNAQDLIRSGVAKLDQVIACRDDIMNALIEWGLQPRDSFRIMERVRKGRGLSEEDAALMREHGVPEWYLDSCNKIKYMFPKAHAVAYVMMAFRIAYFKVHHPVEFYAVYFTIRASEFDPAIATMSAQQLLAASTAAEEKDDSTAREKGLATIYEVAAEAALRGVRILPVDIRFSSASAFSVEGDSLRAPLASVPGLGAAAAESVVAARQERPFTSRLDLRDRTKLTRAHIDTLAQMGAIADLPDSDQLSLF